MKFNTVFLLMLLSYPAVKAQELSFIAVDNAKEGERQYSDKQLEDFLDSVGSLPLQPMVDSTAASADQVFYGRQQMNITLTDKDFAELKSILKSKDYMMAHLDLLKRIFPDYEPDSAAQAAGYRFLTFMPFDKNEYAFNEFAVGLGNSAEAWNMQVYFFKGNKVIAGHKIEHHYGLELDHYRDADGKTVVYYKENFGTGTGIWQFNYYFYKYDGDKLLPVLNILENGNLNGWNSPRSFWLETFVVKEVPLTLKFVYNFSFNDTLEMLSDSSIVKYIYNPESKVFKGDYRKSKIHPGEILTYSLDGSEQLFMNVYYKSLKKWLASADSSKRQGVLAYLERVKTWQDGGEY